MGSQDVSWMALLANVGNIVDSSLAKLQQEKIGRARITMAGLSLTGFRMK